MNGFDSDKPGKRKRVRQMMARAPTLHDSTRNVRVSFCPCSAPSSRLRRKEVRNNPQFDWGKIDGRRFAVLHSKSTQRAGLSRFGATFFVTCFFPVPSISDRQLRRWRVHMKRSRLWRGGSCSPCTSSVLFSRVAQVMLMESSVGTGQAHYGRQYRTFRLRGSLLGQVSFGGASARDAFHFDPKKRC